MTGSCGWFPLGPEEIRGWVDRHRHELPHTLAELSRYPIPFRRMIVSAVPPDVRVALWREHLAGFLAPSARLDGEQQALVRDAIAELPHTVGGLREAGRPRVQALEDRMRRLLTPQQAGQMFGTLGPPEPPEGLPIPPDALPSGGA